MSVLKIRCSDGRLVEVDVEVSKKFGTLKDMFFAAEFQADQEIPLKNVDSKTLEKIVKFVQADGILDKGEFFGTNSIQTLDLMISADYLNVPKLLDSASSFMAEKIKSSLPTNFSASGYCKENLCLKCRALESQKQLKTCQKCLLATYCSKECQAADWHDHKAACKAVKVSSDNTEREFNLLIRRKGYENVFEEDAGRFWFVYVTRDYCNARWDLATEAHNLSKQKRSPKALKAALDHTLELLRLVHKDKLSLRNVAPFFMLDLDRDEDAYNFIKWWLTIDPDSHWDNVPKSQPGEWLYLRDQDLKEDIADFHDPKDWGFHVAHVTAIVLIKARLISKAQEVNLKAELALRKLLKESSKPQGQVKHAFQAVKNHLALFSDQELERQNGLLDKYLDKLLSINPTLVKAVINPVPLMSSEPYRHMAWGSPEEAQLVLAQCLQHFRANTLLMTKIRQLVGPQPVYETKGEFRLRFPDAV